MREEFLLEFGDLRRVQFVEMSLDSGIDHTNLSTISHPFSPSIIKFRFENIYVSFDYLEIKIFLIRINLVRNGRQKIHSLNYVARGFQVVYFYFILFFFVFFDFF